ncbi:oligosaccharide flippase family protein [Bacillus sp. EB01]|uniref:oligosaccharide flippase family protein n=1 Tax=Bacillus sp. EB01 TaxID=1347086 RepID=UPI0005C492B0|nr:oligosaccharide flippase family protein [Bacillus sp. EB01]
MKILYRFLSANSSNERKIGIITSYLNLVLHILIGLLMVPFLIRNLGASEYGLYMLIGAFVGYMSILDFGIGSTIVRYVAKYQSMNKMRDQENFLGLCILIYTAMSLLVLLIGLLFYINIEMIFSSSLTEGQLERAKVMFSLLVINIAVSLPLNSAGSIMRGMEKFLALNSFETIRLIIRPIILVTLLLNGFGVVSIVVVDTILNLTLLLIKVFYVLFILKVKINIFYFDRVLLKEIFSYSFFVFLAVMVDQIYWKLGHTILGIYEDTVKVGIYAIAMQLVLYYMQFATVVSGIFLPRATQLVSQNASKEDLTKLMIRTGRMQLFLLGLFFICFVSIGKEFIRLWAGEEFLEAYFVTLILMVPVTIPMIQTVGVSILQAKKMHRFRAIAYVFTAILNIAISIPLTSLFGIYGATTGTFISLIIGNILIINIYYSKKIGIDIRKFFSSVSKGYIVIIPLLLLFGNILNNLQVLGWLGLLIKAVLITIMYVLLMWLFGLNKDEKNLILTPKKSTN